MTDQNKTLPSLERVLYDQRYDTDTRFGLGVDQILVAPDLAKSTIIAILNDPDREFSGVDINDFIVNELNFDTPEDTIATMRSLYDSFQPADVNYIFFQVLKDAFANKKEFEEFFKTSWVALQITQNVNNPQRPIIEDLNLQAAGGEFIGSMLTPTVTPSVTSIPPTPSATPTITPTITVTPSATP